MPTPELIKQAPFQSVVAGSTATLALPKGLTYAALYLDYQRGGAAATATQFATDITEVRVKVDNRVVRRLSGANINTINAYRGYTANTPNGFFPIIFERPELRNSNQEDFLGLGTLDVANLSIEVDIDSGATSPALSCRALYTAPRTLGQFSTLDFKTYSPASSGEFEITDIPKTGIESPKRAISAFHIIGSTVTRVEVIREGKVIYDMDTNTMEGHLELLRAGGTKTRQANTHHVDFSFRDRLDDHLVLTGQIGGKFATVQDFRIRLHVSGAGDVTLVSEGIEERPAPSA